MSHAYRGIIVRGLIPFFIAVILVIPAVNKLACAQSGGADPSGTGGRHVIQGRIYFPSGRRTDARLKIRLENFNAGALTVLSDSNGSFVFKGLDPGTYTVVVDAGESYETAREPVYIDTDGSSSRRGVTLPPISRLYTVEINLRPKREALQKAAVVSAVLAAVPETARELYRKAIESQQTGDTPKAIEQLKGAIAIYPDFPLALNELGIQYLKLGQAEKAAEVLKIAVRLEPEDFQPLLNYGIALLNQKKFAESEEQLRATLKRNALVPTAHMYLGIALAIQRKLDEGQSELEIAVKSNSTEVSLAHRYLAGIFLERREYKRAADALEDYLKLVPKAPDAEALRQKAKELRQK
jgi:tetratricopeptide (TPR) repeat protein